MTVQAGHPFFEFLIAQCSKDGFNGLDPVSQRLLERVALQHFKGASLTMMGALGLSQQLGVGESTLSKRIKALQAKGLIEVMGAKADRRIKVLGPSPKTTHHYESLSQAMQDICMRHRP